MGCYILAKYENSSMYWQQNPLTKVESRSIKEEVISMEKLGCGSEVKHNVWSSTDVLQL